MDEQNSWFDDYAEEVDEIEINEYDLSSSPNDFNVSTIYNFIESGAVKIPGFQRNYVWDITRASKLIQSLILGIPVPQIFLYEAEKNEFLVIDGQQRLMSIYYFIKQRFPKKNKRSEIRDIFDQEGNLPDNVLHNDEYFENFRLKLPQTSENNLSPFNKLSYPTLGAYKTQFDMRVIRNIIIKQNAPKDDDSSMYEIFNRLNTGGINLKPQEIRTSMYHSKFYEMLNRANALANWRKILNRPEQDIHMKDVEILLRAFAMLIDAENYKPSMVKFLNQFSKKSRNNKDEQNDYLFSLFKSFIDSFQTAPNNAFLNKGGRFNVALFESAFAALCRDAFKNKSTFSGAVDLRKLQIVSDDKEFSASLKEGTTQTKNVLRRIERVSEIFAS